MSVGIYEEPTIEKASGWQKFLAKIIGKTVFLGYGRRAKWDKEAAFYLFRCRHCKKLAVDYDYLEQDPPGDRPFLCPHCQKFSFY